MDITFRTDPSTMDATQATHIPVRNDQLRPRRTRNRYLLWPVP